jgi:hypothetical protein
MGISFRSRLDWLFTVLRPDQEWRAAKFRLMLGAQGLWAGRDLYRATPAVTRELGFPGLIRRTAPFSRLLWHTRGCGGSILTRILTGEISCRCHVHLEPPEWQRLDRRCKDLMILTSRIRITLWDIGLCPSDETVKYEVLCQSSCGT